ncbi:MAG: hypothetical protein KC656_16800 [Myxococcales bacterium]|nr:hypothetical protein [Myxococcales bacterium]MCA9569509.1 hypothetical protein [Myxococcales bacterium]
MATWDDVRAAALRLPEVVEDGRTWRIRRHSLAWERPLRASDRAHLGDVAPEGDILGVRTLDLAAREELLLAMPDVFFVTPHFDGYPAVLARLERMDRALLEHVLEEIWRERAPKRLVRAWDMSGSA